MQLFFFEKFCISKKNDIFKIAKIHRVSIL